MQGWKRWAASGLALGLIGALSPLLTSGPSGLFPDSPELSRLDRRRAEENSELPDLRGLNLLRLKLHPRRVSSPLRHGRNAELTLDPQLQRAASSVMRRYSIPEAGIVVLGAKTGHVLAYANHVQSGPPFDVNSRSEAPAASVFKLVTTAGLLEEPGLTPESKHCYRGGRSKIVAADLVADPKRDLSCTSLALALGLSTNAVFARLAHERLSPEGLTQTAGAFGFGLPTPFDVPTDAPSIDLPPDPLGFARAATGFWHTTLSPLAAASIAQSIANGGQTLRPRIVREISEGRRRKVVWQAPSDPEVLRRATSARTARALADMMAHTVSSGSAFKAFHDAKGRPFLPNIKVAGKTGTLTRHKAKRHYTWFVGFAPADAPEVAISALVVNTPVWRIKAPLLAREVLRAYFAKQGLPGVSPP